MRITPLSKKLIVIIIAVTFALVALVGLVPQRERMPEEVPEVPAEIDDIEALNKQKQEEALVRSLTNFSHDIDSYLLSEGEALYTGYIKGAGNAIFRFNAEADQ